MQGSGIGDQGSGRPPRLADWILKRVLPLGKRGESILGDLHEEFLTVPGSRIPVPVSIALVLGTDLATRAALRERAAHRSNR